MISYQDFKPIRNRLRKHSPVSIIEHCVARLHDPNLWTSDAVRHYPPWNLLLVIKWSLLHGDFDDPRKPRASLNDLNRITNALLQLGDKVRMPNEYPSVWLFLKNIAFQQFWLQREVGAAQIGRQELLFASSFTPRYIREAFEARFAMSIEDFLDLSFMLLARFDRLIALVGSRQVHLPAALSQAVADDATPGKQKFVFDGHLRQYEATQGGDPQHVSRAFENLTSRAEDKLREAEQMAGIPQTGETGT